MEVVSVSSQTVRRSLATARDIGVDRILGGTDVAAARDILGDLAGYFPFAGRPVGHPTQLTGRRHWWPSIARSVAAGCGGVDLLAYRATEADPLDLVRAARTALGNKLLIVAGSVNSPDRIHDLARAGADAFTIGSAALDGSFSPTKGSLRSQIADIWMPAEPGRRSWRRMVDDCLGALIEGRWPDPDGGGCWASPLAPW
jgi:hypothetical protein